MATKRGLSINMIEINLITTVSGYNEILQKNVCGIAGPYLLNKASHTLEYI